MSQRPSQFLRSRGWLPENLQIWEKRGWNLTLEDAFALENVMEREHGAVIPRAQFPEREMPRLRERMRGFLAAHAATLPGRRKS